MNTLTLALFIGALIAAQIAAFVTLGWFRQRARYQALTPMTPGAPASALPCSMPRAASQPLGEGCAKPAPSPATAEAEAPRPAWDGYRTFVVERRVIEDGNASVCSFELVPADGEPLPSFRPGQYLTFDLELPDPAGGAPIRIPRCYSLSDRPRPDRYRVSIKRVPPPPKSPELPAGRASNHFHDRIHEGARLSVRAPSGHFHLIEDSPLPIVLIAGGIGITPLLSILNTLAATRDPREVWLFYGVRDRNEHIMKEHLEGLRATHPGFQLHVCYGAPAATDVAGVDYQHQGWLDIRLLRRTLPFGRHEFYLCGPPPMMEALVPALEDAGVAPENLHYESFGPASLNRRRAPSPSSSIPPTPANAATPAAAPVAVHFSRSGKTVAWDPSAGSLLELAESQGLRVESGCRAGSCGGCQTPVESGAVAYLQTPDADIAPGHCLPCIATPATDLTLPL